VAVSVSVWVDCLIQVLGGVGSGLARDQDFGSNMDHDTDESLAAASSPLYAQGGSTILEDACVL